MPSGMSNEFWNELAMAVNEHRVSGRGLTVKHRKSSPTGKENPLAGSSNPIQIVMEAIHTLTYDELKVLMHLKKTGDACTEAYLRAHLKVKDAKAVLQRLVEHGMVREINTRSTISTTTAFSAVAPLVPPSSLKHKTVIREKSRFSGTVGYDSEVKIDDAHVVEFARLYLMKIRLHYKAGDKAKLGFTTKSIVSSSMFTHFARAVQVCRDIGAEPRHYLDAQFKEAHYFGRRKSCPLPNQLYSPTAILKYTKHAAETNEISEMTERGKEMAFMSEKQRYEMYLENFIKTFKMTRREVMLSFPRDFPQWFHEGEGTWDEVKHVVEE